MYRVQKGPISAEFLVEAGEFVEKTLAKIGARRASLFLLQKEFTEECGAEYQGPYPADDRRIFLLQALHDAILIREKASKVKVIGNLGLPFGTSVMLP